MRFFLSSCLVLALHCCAQAAPLISNGNFETSDGGIGAADWSGGLRNVAGDGHNGSTSLLVLDANYGLTTTQTGTTTSGQLYDLVFYYLITSGLDSAAAASWNGVTLTPVETFADGAWTGQRFSVIGTGSDTVSFAATGTRSLLDDVSLTAVIAAPELSAAQFPLGLLMSSVLLLGSRRRRTIIV